MASKISALALLALGFSGTSAQNCSTWYETTQHGPGFRNVKAYGAKGDGVTDDTAALLNALTQGRTNKFSTLDPTVVYLPAGNYIVSQSLPLFFYTFLVGNFACRPTITLASNTFSSGQAYVIDSDPGDPSGEHTDEFYRGIQHVNINILSGNGGAVAIHWAQSQATHIRNVSITVGDGKSGMFMENGSGGFISDLSVDGGDVGLIVGNQQWTFRNIQVTNARSVGVQLIWDWAFAFVALNITNCPTAIQFQGGAAGSMMLLDSYITNAAVGIESDYPARVAGLLIERLIATNVNLITSGLPGGAGVVNVPAWRQGPYWLDGQLQAGDQGAIPLTRPDTPLTVRARPTFGSADGTSGVFNAYSAGAKGDGVTDDTAALQAAISGNAQVFLPQGIYMVSAPLQLRPDSVLIGEALSNLQAIGGAPAWADASNPQPMLATPTNASSSVQLADLIFTQSGDVPGCISLDWHSGPTGGTWDLHWRTTFTTWGMLRIADTAGGGAAGGYIENTWAWTADHDINTNANLTVLNPRGITVTSTGALSLIGTACEHNALYQYNFSNAAHITTVVTQTETAYWQNPPTGWGMTVTDSEDIHLYGAGFYNWFNGNQTSIFNVVDSDVQMYDINVENSLSVLSGTTTVYSNDTATHNWMCDYLLAFTHS